MRSRILRSFALPLCAVLLLPAVGAAQTTVYSNNFESGSAGAAFSGPASVQGTFGLSAFGFGSQHLRNSERGATVLSLSGLGTHSLLSLSFDLAMWDSIDNGDIFNVKVDGTDLFNASFGNYFTTSDQCEGPGTVLTPSFTGFFAPDYGYAGNRDCARRVAFSFAHSASTAVFSWQYPLSQGGLDESFGIDNVLVQSNGSVQSTVPEPGTYMLLAVGLVGIVTVRRKITR